MLRDRVLRRAACTVSEAFLGRSGVSVLRVAIKKKSSYANYGIKVSVFSEFVIVLDK